MCSYLHKVQHAYKREFGRDIGGDILDLTSVHMRQLLIPIHVYECLYAASPGTPKYCTPLGLCCKEVCAHVYEP